MVASMSPLRSVGENEHRHQPLIELAQNGLFGQPAQRLRDYLKSLGQRHPNDVDLHNQRCPNIFQWPNPKVYESGTQSQNDKDHESNQQPFQQPAAPIAGAFYVRY